MEQKKTLWIIAAAGLFLLVVVGAALILYSPSMHKNQTQRASFGAESGWIGKNQLDASQTYSEETQDQSLSINPFDQIAQTEQTSDSPQQTFVTTPDLNDIQSLSNGAGLASTSSQQNAAGQYNPNFDAASANNPNSSSDITLYTNNVTIATPNSTTYAQNATTIDLNNLNNKVATNVTAQNEKTAEQIKQNQADFEKSEKKATTVASAPKQEKKPVAQATKKETVAKKPSEKPATKSVAKNTAPTTKKAAATVAKADKKPASTQESFWVQAAAYSNKQYAEEARSILANNKMTPEVFTVDSNGQIMYRVRVGPYQSKQEAEYWQSAIASIDKFSNATSQIIKTN